MADNRVASSVVGNLGVKIARDTPGVDRIIIAAAGTLRQKTFSDLGWLVDVVYQFTFPNPFPPHIGWHGHSESDSAASVIADDSDRKVITFDFVDSHMNLHPFKGL